MKLKELREKMHNMTILELEEKLRDSREELFNLRFQMATGHLDNHSRLRELRRQTARILTILGEKKRKEGSR